MNGLEELRKGIDSIDDEILALLDRRMGLVKEIGKLKLKSNNAIYHPKREQEIIKRLLEHKLENIPKSGIQSIYKEIFSTSRYLELPERVAYLGPMGSFTHQVAVSRFGHIGEYIATQNIESIFKAIINKGAKFGVLPIENNSNGIVNESLDFLATYDVKIVAEVNLSIHHSFASNEKLMSNIKKIYSKDIAFGQCREFLNNYSLQDVEFIPLDSTAKAAKMAKEVPNSAAICSNIAASLYELPIMFENIEDSNENMTRFFIISDFESAYSSNAKTSFCAFIDDSTKPGTLANLLGEFSKRKINLIKLQSRPLKKDKSFSYWFYMELEGHINEPHIKEIFTQKGDVLRWLGSYPRDIF